MKPLTVIKEYPTISHKPTTNKPIVNDKMKPTLISEILDKAETPDGMVVKCVEGTLFTLFPEKTGEGQHGAWALQNGSIKDAEGKIIKVVFSNCSQPTGAKGKKLKITSQPSEKHGLQGIKVADTSYESKGKPVEERTIKITASAMIEYDGGAPSGATTKSGPAQTETQKSYPSQRPNNIIRDTLAMHAHVVGEVKNFYQADELSESMMQSFIASVFIESCKQGACMNYIMREGAPTSKVEDSDDGLGKEEKRIVDQRNLFPADWPEAIIPGGSMKGKTLKEIPDDKLVALFEHYDSKSDNGMFAECVYAAAEARGVIPKGSKKEQDDLP